MKTNAFGGGGGDAWDLAAERRSSSMSIGPEKDWDVIVVDSPKVINAMAAPGTFIPCRTRI